MGDTACALTKKRYCFKQDQGNNWGQWDSSSTASASAEEGGKYGMHSKGERKWNSWAMASKPMSSNQVQTTRKYDLQPENRGDNPWKDWAREVRET